jgi:aminoglycoside phosphotransferase
MRARLRLIREAATEISREIFAPPARPQFIRTLAGHSGAEVALYANGPTSLVRKTARAPAGNDRLLRQSAHQRALSSAGLPFPRVLRDGIEPGGRAFFEMEYVPARSLATLLCEAAPFDMAPVIAALERALKFFALSAGAAIPVAVFHDKLRGIAAAAPRAAALVEQLAARDWSGIPASLSHGDLTLENILLCPSRGVVMIDCDQAFVSSWWLDAAKLCQDTAGHWCMRALYREGHGSPAWLNAQQRMVRMHGEVMAMVMRLEPQLASRLPQLTALHLLRTLPYTRDETLAAFTLARAALLLERMP